MTDTYYAVSIVGCPDVGKTSFLGRITKKKFQKQKLDPLSASSSSSSLDPLSISEYHRLNLPGALPRFSLGANVVHIQDESDHLAEISFSTSRGFVLVYSVTDRWTFDQIVEIRKNIMAIKQRTTIFVVLVGNKCDLEFEREVSFSEGADLAEQFGCPFFETSVVTGVNLEQSLFALGQDLFEKERKSLIKPGKH